MADALDEAIQDSRVTRNDVDHVIRAVDALRKAHKDYPEIRKRRGELIELADAIDACMRVVDIAQTEAETLTGAIGEQVVQWLGDDGLRAMSSIDQKRIVQQWAVDRWRSVRSLEPEQLVRAATGG